MIIESIIILKTVLSDLSTAFKKYDHENETTYPGLRNNY